MAMGPKNDQGDVIHVCTKENDIHDIKKIVSDVHHRLFVDDEVDSFQTMFRKGTARMDAQDIEIKMLRDRLQAHEDRPKKVIGFMGVVLPLVIVVGGAAYKIGCWLMDNFQWRATH
jgi:hypothetical protein